MAARFDISMLGSQALSEALAALPEKLERRVVTRATRAAGKFFLTLAKGRAPKETGKLAQTLKLKSLKRRKGRVGVSIQTGTREELGLLAAASSRARATATQRRGLERGILRHYQAALRWYYPAHVELGTKDTAPNPYLRGTLQTARGALLGILRQEIDNGIERELTKGR